MYRTYGIASTLSEILNFVHWCVQQHVYTSTVYIAYTTMHMYFYVYVCLLYHSHFVGGLFLFPGDFCGDLLVVLEEVS